MTVRPAHGVGAADRTAKEERAGPTPAGEDITRVEDSADVRQFGPGGAMPGAAEVGGPQDDRLTRSSFSQYGRFGRFDHPEDPVPVLPDQWRRVISAPDGFM